MRPSDLDVELNWVKDKILSIYLDQNKADERELEDEFDEVDEEINRGDSAKNSRSSYLTLTDFRRNLDRPRRK